MWPPTLDYIAIFISGMTLLYLILDKTPDLFLKFRESTTTMERMNHINAELNIQLEREIIKFQKYCDNNKIVDNEITSELKETYIEIGRTVYVSNTIVKEILENTTGYSETALRSFIYATIVGLVVIIFYSFGLNQPIDIIDISILIIYGIFIVAFIYRGYKRIKKYYKMRVYFSELYEEPTIDKAMEIWREV